MNRRLLSLAVVIAAALPATAARAGSAGLQPGSAFEQRPATAPLVTPGPVTPVAAVDLERYGGAWYEIARVPNRFQRQCARHSVAVYSLRSDGQLSVRNQCLRRNGKVVQATGLARVVDPVSRARLRVSLVSLLGWRPFWGDYWIIGLDDHYRWAVVGSPDRRYGWVLARTAALDDADLASVREVLERNGYAWSRFQLTDTSR